MSFNVPILLILWRRPEATKKLFKVLRILKPQNLYISCDGPRDGNQIEFQKVRKTREIVENEIDWEAKINTFYSQKNVGCKYGVSNSINWFFNNVEEGIILEDDCIPHIDFFEFCEVLLKKYRNDKRIFCISGANQINQKIGNGSYFFSRYNHCWGWASWRRCWNEYDVEMSRWPEFKKSELIQSNFFLKKEQDFWIKSFDKFYFYGFPDSWDYQWFFTALINGGMTIIPNQNLIENIGFGEDATHTKSGKSPLKKIPNKESGSSGILPIEHPSFIIRNEFADRIVERKSFSGPNFLSILWIKRFFKKVNNKISNVVRIIFSRILKF